MYQQHSKLYNAFVKDSSVGPINLNAHLIKNWIDKQDLRNTVTEQGDGFYDQLSDLLRETNDAQFGIVSKLDSTGAWVRDATRAVPLEKRISHDSPVIEANNTLLRCLSRLRAIDYAIHKKFLENDYAQIRSRLRTAFGMLVNDVLIGIQKKRENDEDKLTGLKQWEKYFDTLLVKMLHEADLTKGCVSKNDAEALLSHYRHLSSLLLPARPMVTLTYDEEARVIHRETQYPVTKKTDYQKETIDDLSIVISHPLKEEESSQTIHFTAFQDANHLFSSLDKMDDRALPAQSRKTKLVGLKNAFLVKIELIEVPEDSKLEDLKEVSAILDDTLWLARSASPVYVGKGETKSIIQRHTKENVEQLLLVARTLIPSNIKKVHITGLVTDISHGKQDVIVSHLRDSGYPFSLVPTNFIGTFCEAKLAEGGSVSSQPTKRAERLNSAAEVSLKASADPDTLSYIICESGQDRTGTVIEVMKQKFILDRYNFKKKPIKDIQVICAKGRNAAEITTHHVHGSPGMKIESIANDLIGSGQTFSDEVTRELYTKSANTNKKNPVAEIDLQKPSKLAIDEFDSQWRAFLRALSAIDISTNSKNQALFNSGKLVYQNIDRMIGKSPWALEASELSDLSDILYHINQVLICTNVPGSNDKMKAHIKQLAGFAEHCRQKDASDWKEIGQKVLIFCCAALFVAGLIMAFPVAEVAIIAVIIAAVGVTAYTLNTKRSFAKDLCLFKDTVAPVDGETKGPKSSAVNEGEADDKGDLKQPNRHD